MMSQGRSLELFFGGRCPDGMLATGVSDWTCGALRKQIGQTFARRDAKGIGAHLDTPAVLIAPATEIPAKSSLQAIVR